MRTVLRGALALLLMVVAACGVPPEAREEATDPPADAHQPASSPAPADHPEDVRAAALQPLEESWTAAGAEVDAHPVAAYGVSAGHPAAVEAGMAVLAAGGNAVDAAIAAAYAVGVAEPFGSGIGGGGAALVAEQGAHPVAYDYRDVVRQSGVIPPSEIGIPGFVAGMEALHADHGTIDLADLIAPAIAIAEDGVEVYRMLADQLRIAARRLPVAAIPHFFPGGRPLDVGETLVQPELAATLRGVAAGGAADFYTGDLGAELATLADGIDVSSLEAYAVKRREPVAGAFAGYEVISAPPPLAGATLVQMLQVAEAMGVADAEPGSPEFMHAVAMGWRVADRFRTVQMADPDFTDVPTAELTDVARNAVLAGQVPLERLLEADPSELVSEPGGETTHLVVVDADGTMVSMTNTLTSLWGSGDYALGFFMNDQLSNFGIRLANDPPEPGKRAVSSTVPTVVLDADGRAVLGLGSPGGGRIPMMVAEVLVRWALHGEAIDDAVAAPRFHLVGSRLHVEDDPLGAAEGLRALGYRVEGPPFSYYFGSVQALELDYDAGELRGAADPRRAAAWRAERR